MLPMGYMRYNEAEFIHWVTQQGDFIRAHGRLPYTLRTMLFALVAGLVLLIFGILELVFHEKGERWSPNPVIVIMTLSLVLQIVQRFLRLRFQKIVTNMQASQTAERAEAELRRLGYGPMWTDGKGVGIMRLETSTGFGKERHILVLVPDDGRLWITALDASSPFSTLNRATPFRRLVNRLRLAFEQGIRGPVAAGSAA